MNVKVRCPRCHWSMRTIDVYEVATAVFTRRCAGCRRRWRLVVTPLKAMLPSVKLHRLEWTHILEPEKKFRERKKPLDRSRAQA